MCGLTPCINVLGDNLAASPSPSSLSGSLVSGSSVSILLGEGDSKSIFQPIAETKNAQEVFDEMSESEKSSNGKGTDVQGVNIVEGRDISQQDTLEKPSYASWLKDNRRPKNPPKLEFTEGLVEVEDLVFELDEVSTMEEVEKQWGYCLVGYFTGRFPGLRAVYWLIEVDISRQPIDKFHIKLPYGKRFVQRVYYENYPEFCFHCKEHGHKPSNCMVLNMIEALLEENEEEKGGKEGTQQVESNALLGHPSNDLKERTVSGQNVVKGLNIAAQSSHMNVEKHGTKSAQVAAIQEKQSSEKH